VVANVPGSVKPLQTKVRRIQGLLSARPFVLSLELAKLTTLRQHNRHYQLSANENRKTQR
jgi:hypothetical protein